MIMIIITNIIALLPSSPSPYHHTNTTTVIRYPGWSSMVDGFKAKGLRVLNYINPFFSDATNYTDYMRNNFFLEGKKRGYFVKNKSNESYLMKSLSIEFCMLDVTNPQAVEWMKNVVIKNETILNAGSSGFMCDFGEYLPFDAQLYSKEAAFSVHNKYPELWAKLVSEAIEEMGATDEVIFFMRSGYTHSSNYSNNNIFWLGNFDHLH